MHKDHAIEILRVLAEWFEVSESGPHAGSLLFSDDSTLKDHINMALKGLNP